MAGGFNIGGFRLGKTLFPYPGAAASYSAEAQDYFDRVVAAGGTVNSKDAIATYIDALVALGGAYWDNADQHCLFVGVSFEGCFVPLRNGMTVPTNNNFVSGDQNTSTGLVGDGSTKYIDTNVNNNALSQNDNALTVYVTSGYPTVNGDYPLIGAGGGSTGANQIVPNYNSGVGGETIPTRSMSSGADLSARVVTPRTGFCGMSRDNSANYDVLFDDINTNYTRASQTPYSGEIYVFSRELSGSPFTPTPAGLAAYTVSPAITLGTLKSLQDTLVAAV